MPALADRSLSSDSESQPNASLPHVFVIPPEEDDNRPWCYFDAGNPNRPQYDTSGYDLVKDPDQTILHFEEDDAAAFRRPDPRPDPSDPDPPAPSSSRPSLDRSGSRMSFSEINTLRRRSWGAIVGSDREHSMVDEPPVRVEIPDEDGASSVEADASQDVIEVVLLNRRVRSEDANVNVFPDGMASSRSATSFRARAARVFRSLGRSSGPSNLTGIAGGKRKESLSKEEDRKENGMVADKGKDKQKDKEGTKRKAPPLAPHNLNRAPTRKLSQIFRPSQSQVTNPNGTDSPTSPKTETISTATYSLIQRASAHNSQATRQSRYVEQLDNSFDSRGSANAPVDPTDIGNPTKLRRRSTTVSTDPRVRLVDARMRERGSSVSSVGSGNSSFRRRFSVLDLFAAAASAHSDSNVDIASKPEPVQAGGILRRPSLRIRTRATSPPLPPLPPSPTDSDRTSSASPIVITSATRLGPTRSILLQPRTYGPRTDDDDDEDDDEDDQKEEEEDDDEGDYRAQLSYYDPDALPTSSRYSLPLREMDPTLPTAPTASPAPSKGVTSSAATFGERSASLSIDTSTSTSGEEENLGNESFCELRLDSLQFDSFSFHPEEYDYAVEAKA